MVEIKISIKEVIEAINNASSYEDEITEVVLFKVVDYLCSLGDEEIAKFIRSINNDDFIEHLFKILSNKQRLKNIIPMVWNHKPIIKSFESLFIDYFIENSKDYIIKVIEKINDEFKIEEVVLKLLDEKVKIDGLDKVVNIRKVLSYETLENRSFIFLFKLLLAHKFYGILSDSELDEILELLKKRFMRIRSYDWEGLKDCIELYIEFNKVEDVKVMKRLMHILEKIKEYEED